MDKNEFTIFKWLKINPKGYYLAFTFQCPQRVLLGAQSQQQVYTLWVLAYSLLRAGWWVPQTIWRVLSEIFTVWLLKFADC